MLLPPIFFFPMINLDICRCLYMKQCLPIAFQKGLVYCFKKHHEYPYSNSFEFVQCFHVYCYFYYVNPNMSRVCVYIFLLILEVVFCSFYIGLSALLLSRF